MFDLSTLTALVTGATGGIGQEIALTLASQGARVALSGTRASVLEEIASDIRARKGEAIVLPCSLTDVVAVDALVSHVEEKWGSCDILVNNAGITRDGLFMRMKDTDWCDVLDVNLTASFRLCRAAIKGMIKRRWGRIINISSVVGVTGNPGQANYCAAKAGMMGMSKALAQEVATRGITVNCVAPGFIETPMINEITSTAKERILNGIPMNRMGTGLEIAHGVAFLASREAAYITGQTLHINGGLTMI